MRFLRGSKRRTDEFYMRRALELARRGLGRTSPNPAVGAVIVKDGEIKGFGYHRNFGGPHAEIEALNMAERKGQNVRGATMFITLEPCSHYGKTPPCTEAIIRSGIKRVLAATRDLNPLVSGRGFRALRRAGIDVDEGLLKEETNWLYAPFFKWARKGEPFVTVKVAQSLDGKIATRRGESKWISSPESRRFVHTLRAQVDAIMVGANTVLMDDPLLTVRGSTHKARCGRQAPIKVVLDPHRRVPKTARIFSAESPGETILVRENKKGKIDLHKLMRNLARRGITHILLEGGGATIAEALRQKVVDRLIFIIAPIVIGGRDAPTAVEGEGARRLKEALRFGRTTCRQSGRDYVIELTQH